ncbi:MAG: nuclear transport factor 2 family protein [Acidimicrobiales bacterium]|nr:nuclear transport factor 2 family protein [Acidimicrobiales bacterium]HRW36698.1 nuclear transport factor 2 family protein [Aquihabitans sp.]
MAHPSEEVAAAVARYRELRAAIGRGEADWPALADLFTDDAIYIDPAWGRIQGRDEIRAFMVESMTGLEDWEFPIEFVAVDGDQVVVKWTQVLPGAKPDGERWTQSGVSTLLYAGGGRFSYEEDLLNMAHVLEDIVASGWTPGPGFTPPPAQPDRRFARPS